MKNSKILILSIMISFSLFSCGCSAKSNAPESQAGPYSIGDIILADGSVIAGNDFTAADSGNPPAAVIAGQNDDGTFWGVGVHRSEEPLQWAPENTAGYTTKFTGIVCTPDNRSADVRFSGDAGGSGSWEIICLEDPQGTADAAANYPAFHFVNTYAESHGLTGKYSDGWYLPGIAKLSVLYDNRNAVNASLQSIYRQDPAAAMNGLGTNWYWTSSQSASDNDYAWFMHYFNGYSDCCPKSFTNLHVLAVHDF